MICMRSFSVPAPKLSQLYTLPKENDGRTSVDAGVEPSGIGVNDNALYNLSAIIIVPKIGIKVAFRRHQAGGHHQKAPDTHINSSVMRPVPGPTLAIFFSERPTRRYFPLAEKYISFSNVWLCGPYTSCERLRTYPVIDVGLRVWIHEATLRLWPEILLRSQLGTIYQCSDISIRIRG